MVQNKGFVKLPRNNYTALMSAVARDVLVEKWTVAVSVACEGYTTLSKL